MNKFLRFYFWFLILLQSPFAWTSHSTKIDLLISKLPEYKQFDHLFRFEKIEGGLTNHNFKVIFPTQSYFVRLKSDNLELLGLNADREFFCTQTAASLGIAPSIILYLPEEHAMAFSYIASKPPEKNQAAYRRVLATVRHFHQSDVILPTIFCPYECINDYYRHAINLRPDHHIPLASYVLPIVEEIRTAIPRFGTLAPCHLDLYNLNFLDDGEKIWIIDWEYSAMADPLFDIATLVSSDRLTFSEMQDLLELYIESPTEKDLAYLYLMTLLADIRWWLWNYIQAEVSQIQSQYLDFADYSLYHILQKIAHPHYQESLRLLKAKDEGTDT